MRTDIIMPQMGESIAEGTVVKWLKKPGDKVERDEDLFEISTDKVESVIPSPVSGYLAAIVVSAGTKVEINTVVGFITDDAADIDGETAAAAPAAASAANAKPETPAASATTSAAVATATVAIAVAEADASAAELRRVRSTPLVRRIAREHGVDISRIKGTGLSGRVTKKDILAYLDSGAHQAAPVAGSPVQYAPSVTVHAPNVPVGPRDRVEPMSVMRQGIAEHMVMSRRVSAHCQTVHE